MNAFAERAERYVAAFGADTSEQLIANVRTQVALIDAGGCRLPITINDSPDPWPNSYVCSPRTHYCRYAKEELRLLRLPPVRWALASLADVVGVALDAAAVDRTVFVNNWLLSTNLYPDPSLLDLGQVHARLLDSYPDHFIAFRSLNRWANRDLIRQLEALGYHLLGSRQVYVFDPDTIRRGRSNNRSHDRRLLRKTSYRVVAHGELSADDYPRMADLYRQLYLQKYSRHNPEFTANFLRMCHQEGIMRFAGLRSSAGKLDGILGLFAMGDIVTAPVVGYDRDVDRRAGLYRLLMALVFEAAAEHGWRVNLSSGAAHFKRLRGGTAATEYTAVYSGHLPAARRAALRLLQLPVNGLGVPLMRWLHL